MFFFLLYIYVYVYFVFDCVLGLAVWMIRVRVDQRPAWGGHGLRLFSRALSVTWPWLGSAISRSGCGISQQSGWCVSPSECKCIFQQCKNPSIPRISNYIFSLLPSHLETNQKEQHLSNFPIFRFSTLKINILYVKFKIGRKGKIFTKTRYAFWNFSDLIIFNQQRVWIKKNVNLGSIYHLSNQK